MRQCVILGIMSVINKGKFGKIAGFVASLGLVALMSAGCESDDADGEKGDSQTAERTRITFFAAASMTETLAAIAQRYEAEHPDTEIVFSFDSSGTLKTLIIEGAYCDIFMSASPRQMNQLDSGNGENEGYLMSGTRTDLLENQVVLVVPDGNPKGIKGFDDLIKRLGDGGILLAVGNSDVPVGQYSAKLFLAYGLNPDELYGSGTLTIGNNVKEITSQVKESVADAGIIYATDAKSAGLTVVDTAPEKAVGRVIYPVAVLKGSKHAGKAEDIIEYLKNDESRKIFESVGFKSLILQPADESKIFTD